MISDSFGDVEFRTPLVRLRRLFADADVEVFAKLEFMNPTGSIKDRPARHAVRRYLADGTLKPGGRLVESTSGNFGIALAMNSLVHGLKCTLVVDPLATATNVALMRGYRAEVVQVSEIDKDGGYLHTRIAEVQKILAHDPEAVWINQYANRLNWEAHYLGTGSEIVAELPDRIDYLVAGLSTSGTIMGIARRLRESHPSVKVIAVDAVGSLIFGGKPRPRRLPGIGASRRPELLDESVIDRVIHISDDEAIAGCHQLRDAEAILAGGSSGAVVAAIRRLIPNVSAGSRIVTLLPDRGERYLDLIYDSPSAAPWHNRAAARCLQGEAPV